MHGQIITSANLYQAPFGTLRLCYSDKGLARLTTRLDPHAKAFGHSPFANAWHQLLDTYFATGQINTSRLPAIDIDGTAFQQDVWTALRAIPSGQTRSYSDIAKAIGRPNAVRAVGGACGANPIFLVTPCHRVVSSDYKSGHNSKNLGGFSSDHGTDLKRWLLDFEASMQADQTTA